MMDQQAISLAARERSDAIAALEVMGVTRKQLAEAFGVSVNRIAQLVATSIARQAKKHRVPVRVIENHRKPRAHGEKGKGYSASASIAQREALRVWEQNARDIVAECEAMHNNGLFDIAQRLKVHREEAVAALSEFKADCFADEVMAIKRHFDSMSAAEKAEVKPQLASRIDALLSEIRLTSKRSDGVVISMASARAKRAA